MLKKTIFISLLSISLLFQACGNKEEKITTSNEFILTSTDNKKYIIEKKLDGFVLKSAEDKIIMFDIYATWCPPCKTSATHLTSLQNKFKDDLIILGLSIEEDISNTELIEFKKKYNADYALINSNKNRPLIDAIANTIDLGDRFPIPLMVLYKGGKLITYYIGEVKEEFIESDIKRALGK